MEEEKKETSSTDVTIGEFKGKPVIRIPVVDNPSPDTAWHWFTFGKNKAKAIVKFYEQIKKFAES